MDEETTVDDRRRSEHGEPRARTLPGERYEEVRRIGKGGMGEVIAASDAQIGREVAIKRMIGAPSERAIARFLREAQIQGRLEHPAIVPVHEIGRDADGLPYFAMKKLTGTTLAKLLEAGTTPRQALLRAFVDVCLAVEFAHVRGVVHRDLKPQNIMLGDFGEVYVLDWGVAKVLGTADELADVASDSGSGEHATAAGTAIGTPGYMAPEQIRGEVDLDARADVYALGCVLFAILAGEHLHGSSDDALASMRHGIDARPSRRAPDRGIAPELDAICVEATAVSREQRLGSARELADRVQRFLDGDRDLQLRQDLAKQHLAAAGGAFAEGSPAARKLAMREATTALALDPVLAPAAQLVARLMLEPPAELPAEVQARVEADGQALAKQTARGAMWAFAAFAALLAVIDVFEPSRYVLAIVGLLGVSAAVCALASRRHGDLYAGLLAASNVGIVAVVAHGYSPLWIAPSIATIISLLTVMTPSRSSWTKPLPIALAMCGAVLVPLALEMQGVLHRTLAITPGHLELDLPALAGRPLLVPFLTVYVVVLLTAACMIGGAIRRRDEHAKQRLMTQAWQLEQLLPGA